jgi:molybdopterin-binding protein
MRFGHADAAMRMRRCGCGLWHRFRIVQASAATDQERMQPMRISARNQLKGRIVAIEKGVTTAHVKIDVGGTVVTAAITNASVEELGLAVGQAAYAVVKASDVMVAID